MNRLTRWNEEERCWNGVKRAVGDYVGNQEMINRLAAYENTRLTPEEVVKLIAERDRLKARCEAMERALKSFRSCDTCAHEATDHCRHCQTSNGLPGYSFDEARFAPEEATS